MRQHQHPVGIRRPIAKWLQCHQVTLYL